MFKKSLIFYIFWSQLSLRSYVFCIQETNPNSEKYDFFYFLKSNIFIVNPIPSINPISSFVNLDLYTVNPNHIAVNPIYYTVHPFNPINLQLIHNLVRKISYVLKKILKTVMFYSY